MLTFVFKGRIISVSMPVLMLACLLLGLMALAGFWQLSRAKEKNLMAEHYEWAQQREPLRYDVLDYNPDDIRYRQVELAGQYLADKQFLLDNRVYTDKGQKQVGYQVLTPLLVQQDKVILVDRGWRPAAVDRRVLPNVGVGEQQRQIEGVMTTPGDAFKIGEADASLKWPRVITYIDYEKISQRLKLEVYPAVLVLNADQQDRYVYNWKPVIKGPWMHYSYAFQWFAMCLMLVIALFIAGFRMGARREKSE